MTKYCFNYETGEYEWITEDGFSLNQGGYTFNWDDGEYEIEREEEQEPRV